VAAAALQSGALFLLRHFLDVKPDWLFGLSVDLRQSVSLLATLIFIALASSALLTFFQRRGVLDLWRGYQIHAINSVLHEVQQACRRGVLDEVSVGLSPIPYTLRQSHRLGLLARVVANTVAPAARFIALGVFAISVDPFLTVALFLAAVPSGALAIFYFARQASRSARRAEALARSARQDMDARLGASIEGRVRFISEKQRSPFVRRLRLLIERLTWVESARLATGMITIVMLAALILFAGYAGSTSSIQWSQVLLYVLALMLAFSQLIALASAISSFGRFYPALIRHKLLLETMREAQSTEDFRKRLSRENLAGMIDDDDDEFV
jgi:ABC-type multidrug transport system fused ATPase/permease subunit